MEMGREWDTSTPRKITMVSARFCHCNQLPCVCAIAIRPMWSWLDPGTLESQAPLYGRQLVMTHMANWKIAIEIVDFPIAWWIFPWICEITRVYQL